MTDGQSTSALVDFIAGTVAGIASLLAGHPFDTVKTRLQAQASRTSATSTAPTSASSLLLQHQNGTNGGRRYRSALDALRTIVREEGVMGLFKGVTSPMLGVAAMNASVFGVYGMTLRFLEGGGHEGATAMAGEETAAIVSSAQSTSLTHIFLAGCASGIVTALITSPIDLVKIRQQLSFPASASTSSSLSPTLGQTAHRRGALTAEPRTIDVVRDIWRRGGLRGLYRGLGCTCIRDLGYGPYFLSYEVLNRALLSLHEVQDGQRPKLSSLELALSGGIAGLVGWLSTFGVDVVKTRVQASEAPLSSSSLSSSRPPRSAFLHAVAQTYREGGSRAFLAGVGPTIVRALPVNAVLFITFESTKDALQQWGL